MCPLSGFSNPSVSLRMVLFPEPATPKIALVSPLARRKEIPSSTRFSSNAIETFSNTTISAVPSGPDGVRCSIAAGGAAMGLAITEDCHQELGRKEIHKKNKNG